MSATVLPQVIAAAPGGIELALQLSKASETIYALIHSAQALETHAQQLLELVRQRDAQIAELETQLTIARMMR